MVAQGRFTDPADEAPLHAVEPREGSTLHYALLRTPQPVRTQAIHALNLLQTISQALTGVQEPQIAHTKLQWWREELTRLQLGQARHPSTQRCQGWLQQTTPMTESLLRVLEAVQSSHFDAPTDDASWSALLTNDFSARLDMVQQALLSSANSAANTASSTDAENTTEKTTTGLEDFAMAFAWVDILRTLPKRIHHEQWALPPSLYEQFDVTSVDLQQHMRVAGRDAIDKPANTVHAISQLVEAAISQGLTAVDKAIATPVYQQCHANPETRAISAWLQLRKAQLKLWQTEHHTNATA